MESRQVGRESREEEARSYLEQGMLYELDVSYFYNNEKQHLIEVLEETKVNKYILVKSQ